jgi:hypothetical protein
MKNLIQIGIFTLIIIVGLFGIAKKAEALSIKTMFAAVSKAIFLERPVMSSINFSCISNSPQAIIAWTPVTNASTYTISRMSPGGTGWPQVAVNISQTSFIDKSFPAGPGVYSYQVKANASGWRSSYSNIETVRVSTCQTSNPTPTPVITPVTVTPPPPVPQTTPQQATTTTSSKKEWGAYVGWRESDMATFESQVGKETKYQAVFVHWGNENLFPLYLSPTVKDKNKTLIIFWEATDYNLTTTDQPRFSYDAITRGDWNTYLTQFAADAKAYGGPVIIIPFSEMNGNWFNWSGTVNGNTPDKHIQAYRYLRSFFSNASNVKFGWAPNSDSVPDVASNQLELYYPGNNYVDYVGVDGFNFSNPWMTFDQVFSKSLAKLKTYGKPVFIFSFATAEGAQKPAWITDALTVQIPKYPEIKAFIWFNERKEKDWRVWSDQASLDAFKKAVAGL